MKQTTLLSLNTLWVLLTISIFATAAYADYQFGLVYVQHREYEDGRSNNKAFFEILDENGDFIPNVDVVTDAKLYDPNGHQVNIPEWTVDEMDYFSGQYDMDNGKWVYNDSFLINSYAAYFTDALTTGTYRFEIKADDGLTYEKTYTFNGQIDLPQISSSSFQLHPDTYGNVFFTWEVPDKLCRFSQNYGTNLKVYIAIYSSEKLTGWFSVKIPAHMGRLFIPASNVQEIMNSGDQFVVGLDLRTTDLDNRYWSTGLTVDDLTSYFPPNARQQVEAFITRFYQLCLNRTPDQGGLDAYVDYLLDGTMTGAQVAYNFVFSPEFLDQDTTNAQYLQVLYEAFFNRAPDAAGYSVWYQKLNNSEMSRLEALNAFTGAQEFLNLCEDYGITAQ
jgi:hypothetical protein